MNRNITLSTLSIMSLVVGCTNATNHKGDEAPNIIYVFPDQHRNAALGFWSKPEFKEHVNFTGDPVLTPNIDKFAEEALVLTHAMSNCPLSSPHRGSLFTGMYPNNSGVPLNCNSNRPISSLRDDLTCMSDVFSQSGYNCAYIGKLHLNFPTPNNPQKKGEYVESQRPVWDAYTPKSKRHGFDYWYSYGTFDVHKQPHYWDTEGNRHEIREWSPKHEADKAIAYLRNENSERDSTKPFFLMISMNPPHSPYNSLKDCMEEDYLLYENTPLEELLIRPNANPERAKARSVRYYFASVTGVDREFGRILNELEHLGLDKNTIVVYTSDHGETMCSQDLDDPKNSPYSESMNVPFLIRYPDIIKPRVDDFILSSPDIMPTLLELAGLTKQTPTNLHGNSQAKLILGDKNGIRNKGALYIRNIDGDRSKEGLVENYFPVARGIKTANYTLSISINKEDNSINKTLLFDDKNDPYQLNNITFNTNQEFIKELLDEMGKQLKEINDPWYQNKILDHVINY